MKRLQLFPDTTHIVNKTLTVDSQGLDFLADTYGTPLYVYDVNTMNHAVRAYRHALASSYPKSASVTYAGKAYLSTALAQWTHRQDLWVDCTGEGEIAIAKAGGLSRDRMIVHGVNKSDADLQAAIRDAGTLVVDNLSELQRLSAFYSAHAGVEPRHKGLSIWLRLQPGLAVATHAYTQTGQHNSKFGLEAEDFLEAVLFCKENRLPMNGLHFHQGSQFRDSAPLKPAIELALDLAKQIGFTGEWHFSPGGGWGVAYHEDELPHPEIETYVKLISETIVHTCKDLDLELPHLHLEPGRSLVARAGVAIYRVHTVKRQGGRTWLLVDGGLADNPRLALYGTKYSALPVTDPERERSERVYVAGPYCESGDVILEDLPMPTIEEGELIAIPMSGAYQLSMSSNYNGARRPAVLWLENEKARLIQRRETIEDLLLRDVVSQ